VFFDGVKKVELVPLASNIDITTYSMGETILEQGGYPTGLYLIKSGMAQVFTNSYKLRPK
jgi:signal-transduction protein with cAMP-binding, CBS, and nucleotidyltransferase domain